MSREKIPGKKIVSTFPVSGIYAVYEDQGKFFKEKIHAFAIVEDLEEDPDLIDYEKCVPITYTEIMDGIDTEAIREKISGNFVGYYDENPDWEELKPGETLKDWQCVNPKYKDAPIIIKTENKPGI